jgi:hypothetical protein
VRLPFIHGLNDVAEFLYSTTDVAIWSTCETGIGLAASAVATLRPLLRQVFGELSTNGASEQKRSRTWGGPSRSGYQAHSSRGADNDIPLKSHDRTLTSVKIASSRDMSPSGSTAGLRDWEQEKSAGLSFSPEFSSGNGGIMKTVNITQS